MNTATEQPTMHERVTAFLDLKIDLTPGASFGGEHGDTFRHLVHFNEDRYELRRLVQAYPSYDWGYILESAARINSDDSDSWWAQGLLDSVDLAAQNPRLVSRLCNNRMARVRQTMAENHTLPLTRLDMLIGSDELRCDPDRHHGCRGQA